MFWLRNEKKCVSYALIWGACIILLHLSFFFNIFVSLEMQTLILILVSLLLMIILYKVYKVKQLHAGFYLIRFALAYFSHNFMKAKIAKIKPDIKVFFINF